MNTPHKHAEVIKAWADGAQIQEFSHGVWIDIKDPYPSWYTNVQYRVKPEPDYPKTNLTDEELEELFDPGSTFDEGRRDVANGAIRQAIIDGQVIINPEKV